MRRELRQLRDRLAAQQDTKALTTRDMRDVRPQLTGGRAVYPSQVPVLDPYQTRDMYGAYSRGRLYAGYGHGASFELLRVAARRCLLIQAVHSCCLHEFTQLAPYAPTRKDLGWRIEPRGIRDADDPRALDAHVRDTSPELAARRDVVQARLECPHPLYEQTFAGFLQKILKDHLTINRVVIELIRNQRGQVVQFRAIDGATILPTYCILERFIEQRAWGAGKPMGYETAARMLEQETGHPVRDAEYVCVMRGQLVGTFAPGELLVWEFDPSTDIREIFAPSYVEKALEGIISWLYAFAYNKNYFQVGNPIEVILGISGAIEDDSFVALQEQLRENFSGLKGAWRVPLVQLPVDGMLSVIKLKENHKDMQFMEWIDVLISLVCAVYRKHPNRIYFAGKANEGTMLFEHSKEAEIEASEEEGFRNNRIFFGQHLDNLVRLLDPKMTFTWSGLDVEDEQGQITIETQEVTHYLSIDKLLERKGEEPYRQPWSQVPLNALVFQAAGLTGGGPGGEGDEGGDEGDQAQPPSRMAQLMAGMRQQGRVLPGTAANDRHDDATASKSLTWEEIVV